MLPQVSDEVVHVLLSGPGGTAHVERFETSDERCLIARRLAPQPWVLQHDALRAYGHQNRPRQDRIPGREDLAERATGHLSREDQNAGAGRHGGGELLYALFRFPLVDGQRIISDDSALIQRDVQQVIDDGCSTRDALERVCDPDAKQDSVVERAAWIAREGRTLLPTVDNPCRDDGSLRGERFWRLGRREIGLCNA